MRLEDNKYDISLSIIIPIYNGEKYIRKFITWIQSEWKSFSDFEIILIDDGSKDKSLEICREISSKDNRIRFFSQQNRGVSTARNLGLENCRGKYIIFWDIDDRVELPLYLEMIKMVSKYDLDLVICNHTYEDSQGNLLREKKSYYEKNYDKYQSAKMMICEDAIGGYLWNKVYRYSLIAQNNILFNESVGIYEDLIFNLNYISCTDKVRYIDKTGYHYIKHSDSVMNSSSVAKYVYALEALENEYKKFKKIFINIDEYIIKMFVDIIDVIERKTRTSQEAFSYEHLYIIRQIIKKYFLKIFLNNKTNYKQKLKIVFLMFFPYNSKKRRCDVYGRGSS